MRCDGTASELGRTGTPLLVQLLIEWAAVTRDRDNRVRAAVAAGVAKYRVSQLTGIGRSTIDRSLAGKKEAS
jgi:hypothetical protein